MVLPERKITSIEKFLEKINGVKTVMFDGTERPVQRPQDNEQHDSTLPHVKSSLDSCKHLTGYDVGTSESSS